MNITNRKTRACTLDTLDEDLKAAIRDHAVKYGLNDLESEVLMCCETLSVRQKRGFWGGIKTTLSAVYVTRRWLVWADSTDRSDARVGASELIYVDIWDDQTATDSPITSDEGLNITGRYTDESRTGLVFIVLDSNLDGRKFRQVLAEVLSKAAYKQHAVYQSEEVSEKF